LLENHTLNEKEFIEVVKETKLIEAIDPGVLESSFPRILSKYSC